jgi:pimeloyl-ACP methyl ester carboxylesterase
VAGWWRRRHRDLIAVAAATTVLCAAGAVYQAQAPRWAATALLQPVRRAPAAPSSGVYEPFRLQVNGVTLLGWKFPTLGPRVGTLIYLHGVGDNRRAGIGLVERFTRLGFDVVAYDSRAHGESTGDFCTYGYYERQDLKAVIAALPPGRVVLIGHSLGAAIALQTAAEITVDAVVSAETFSDLRVVAEERAPRLLTASVVQAAFRMAEQQGRFRVDEVSPVRAAPRIASPVFLIHGADDVATRPEHSKRVFAALRGPKRLLIVPGVGHSQSLNGAALAAVEAWLLELGIGRRVS